MKNNKNEYKPLQLFLKMFIDERLQKNITVRQKNSMFLYNYNNLVLVERDHPAIMVCRGIVLDEKGDVLNYPFYRFFNYFEKEADTMDWESAEVQEKIDGSLICVFRNLDKEIEITTRGSFYPNKSGFNYAELFKQQFDSFDSLNPHYCYMFELVTAENRIVKFYDDEFVCLIGARDLRSGSEITQIELDVIAKKLNVLRPKRYQAHNLNECLKLFKSFDDDNEGLVVVDKYFNRLKVKQETYFNLSKIMMLKDQDILDYVRGRTELDAELLYREKTVSEKIKTIDVEYQQFRELVNTTFEQIKSSSNSRRNFALKAIQYPFKAFLFCQYDDKDINSVQLKYEFMQECLNKKTLKK